MKLYLIFSIALLSMCLNLTSTYAQSTNVDSPTVLTDGQLTVNATNQPQDYYYTFNALVGEVKLTGDGIGNYAAFTVNIEDEDLKLLKTFIFFSNTPMKRTIARMTFAKAQKIIVKIKTTKNNNASLALRLEGAAQFGGGMNFNQNPIPTSSTSSPTNIPTSGTPVGNTPNPNTGQTPNATYNPNTGQTPTPTYNQNTGQTPTPTYNPSTGQTPTPTDNTNTGQTQTPNTGSQALSSESSRKVIVVLKNGQIIEGTYNGSSIFNNEIGKKITLTVRGKDLPKFNPDDVRSITIEQ